MLPFPTAFYSPRWEPYPWLPRAVGAVYPDEVIFGRPANITGFQFGHICGTEDEFRRGAVYNPSLDPVIYDRDHIPLCCERIVPCAATDCKQDQFNGAPASQVYQYAIDALDATGDTPALVQLVGEAVGGITPILPGVVSYWLPAGTDGPAGWEEIMYSDPDGVPIERIERFTIDSTHVAEQTWDVLGWSVGVTTGSVSGELTLRAVGSQLELSGSNVQIDPGILPAIQPTYTHQLVIATGTDQAGAAAITAPSVAIRNDSTDGAGIRLPTVDTGVPYSFTVTNVSSTKSFKIYPPTGQAFIPGFTPNAPVTIPPQRIFFIRRVATAQFAVFASISTV